MADLVAILESGDLTNIQKGGIGVPESVPNNGEVDVKIAAAIDPLATKNDIEVLQFDPSIPDPAWAEGNLFYDNLHKCLAFHNNVSGITVQLSQEVNLRIRNETGATIPDGTPVRLTGVDVATKIPTVGLAVADSFVNALVLGVSTNQVLDGEDGFATVRGEIHGLDTSMFPAGTRLYLDATTPGTLTDTPPDIVTYLGVVIYSHATEGVINVNPDSNRALPTTIGLLDGKVGTVNLTTSYQEITGYTTEDSIITPVDATLGTISPVAAGRYRVTVNCTMTVPSAPSTRTVSLQVWDKVHSEQFAISSINISKDATQVSRSFSKIANIDADDAVVIRMLSSTSISGVVFNDLSIDIVALSVTESL